MNMSKPISKTVDLTCSITDIMAANFSGIDNKGTQECEDDTFTADVTVNFNDPPATGTLKLSGDATASASVSQLSGGVHTFQVTMSADGTPIHLTAFFSALPTCMRTETDAGQNGQNAPLQCAGLCSGPSTGGAYPTCWPDELETDECEKSLNYAPDPDHPEHTPIRYVKVVLHIFQKEDPAQLGQWVVHPTDPGNFTIADLGILQSWFTATGGPNGVMSNLCDDPTDGSPHIPDARIRFLNEGIINQDVFFHPDNMAWGVGYGKCGNSGASSEWYDMDDNYVKNPSTSHPQYNALVDPETKNAFHVFITGGTWEPVAPGDPNIPDGDDCYWHCAGGMTSDMGCTTSGGVSPNPIQAIFGTYYVWLTQGQQQGPAPECSSDYPAGGDAALGGAITGEFLHVLGVDHISPLQAHKNHAVGVDGCTDTPWDSETNLMGCNYHYPGGRCTLTKCQLGKIHYVFDKLNPAFERFPVAGGGFSRTDRNCDITEADIVIKNNESITWNSDRQLRSNVVVEPGGRLYIYCRVGMHENAKITVQPNGRLFLYGEVYNNCDGQRWQGVVVNGNSGLPQGFPPTNQGYFVNRGIIEGANTSIRVESGGMVIGIGAYIRNSGGMLFEPYSFPQKGWFSGCDFTCDGNTYDFGGIPYKHAELHAVNNVRFSSCDFSVENAPAGQLSNTAGIVADGSRFSVTSASRFRGFDTGIHAAGQFSSANAFTVNGCTFSNNQTGIVALGMQNFTVTENTFEVGGADFQSNSPCGLMMDNCTGYTVEENTFYGQNNVATGRFGIMTEDSGDDANLISGNNFDYLEYANIAQGDNRGVLQGLQYHCNANGGHNLRDFYVPGGFKQEGIHINQGNGKAAMNTFSHFGAFIDGDFRNEVGVIVYNYKNDPAHEPQNPTGITKIQTLDLNTCPSDEPPCDFPCEYTAAEWQQHESAFNTAKSNWQTEKASLLSLMDGGDTDGLLAQINGATSLNAGQVVQDLLNRSPWLSTQALTATINKKQVLTENSVVQILNANPQGLREAAVRSLVQSSFSQTVSNGILANTGTQTARTAKENLVGQYRAAMLRKADLLIQDILKDTAQVDVPLLRTWLANKQSLDADYAIVESYLSEGDFATASQKLDAIPQAYALDAEGVIEHGYFADLADLWQDTYSNGKNMSELDQVGISAVQYIADNSRRRAGAMAQGIMNTWYGGHYRVVPILPGGEGSQGLIAPPIGNSAVPSANYLSVFPNPARSSVYFHWNLPDGIENATISITDLQGKLLEVIEVAGQKGKQEWSVEQLEHGIYIFHVKLPDGNTQTSKLAIIK